MHRPHLLLSLLLAAPLIGCGGGDPLPQEPSSGERRALQDAAEMLERPRSPVNREEGANSDTGAGPQNAPGPAG